MATQLDQILARTALDVAERKAAADLPALERRAAAHYPRGFAANLKAISEVKSHPAVIAELKKASPSRGIIRPSFDPKSLAKSLEAAGAGALSVLTDGPFFQGSLRNLEIASAATTIPCLPGPRSPRLACRCHPADRRRPKRRRPETPQQRSLRPRPRRSVRSPRPQRA